MQLQKLVLGPLACSLIGVVSAIPAGHEAGPSRPGAPDDRGHEAGTSDLHRPLLHKPATYGSSHSIPETSNYQKWAQRAQHYKVDLQPGTTYLFTDDRHPPVVAIAVVVTFDETTSSPLSKTLDATAHYYTLSVQNGALKKGVWDDKQHKNWLITKPYPFVMRIFDPKSISKLDLLAETIVKSGKLGRETYRSDFVDELIQMSKRQMTSKHPPPRAGGTSGAV